jgi:outer membrane protein assembly factor BamB
MKRSKCHLFFSFLTISILLLTTNAYADDWTVGVGGKPARHSLSSEYGPTAPNILWQVGLPAVIAQQAVIEGDVVVMPRIHDLYDVLHGTLIVAHDLNTGDTLWTVDLPVDFPSTDWRNFVSAMRDGKVYATRAGNTNASYMYALDAVTGATVWRSDSLIDESSTEGVSFADNGDLIVGNFTSVMRIDATDGSTLWKTTRYSPTSGGSQAAVYGPSVYTWEASAYGPKISVYDINTGGYLYSSYSIGGGLPQQVAPFVGPNGLVYAPRTQNNPATDSLVAFADIDTALEKVWSVPIGYVPFASFGVGPDGSVYSYSVNGEVIRINSSGNIINTSQQILIDYPSQPRMAIGADGIVYVTNGGSSNGALYSFDPDLTLRWYTPILNVNIGGPAIGQNGTMIVCGIGTDVRAYEGGTGVNYGSCDMIQPAILAIFPNPFNNAVRIRYTIHDTRCTIDEYPDSRGSATGSSKNVIPDISIYDASGRLVKVFSLQPSALGNQSSVTWDGTDDLGLHVSYGVYFVDLNFSGEHITGNLLYIK